MHYHMIMRKACKLTSSTYSAIYFRLIIDNDLKMIIDKSVLNSFGIQTNDEEVDLPYIYWIPKMHKIPTNTHLLRVHRSVKPSLYMFYSQNHRVLRRPRIPCSFTVWCEATWNGGGVSRLCTKLLTHIKQGLQKFCETAYSRRGS